MPEVAAAVVQEATGVAGVVFAPQVVLVQVLLDDAVAGVQEAVGVGPPGTVLHDVVV